MLSYERGPGDVFITLRSWAGIEPDEKGHPAVWPDKFLAKLIVCPWCLGVWVLPLIWGLWEVWPMAVVVLAAATILVAVEQWNSR